jgi:hypothetical protein
MKKLKRHIMIVLNLFAAVVIAQTPVGFKNPNDISPVKAYRLPTWGYSSLDLSFDFSGNGNQQKSTDVEKTYIVNALSFRPVLIKYHESETNIYSLQSSLSGLYEYRKDQTDSSAQERSNSGWRNKSQQFSYSIDGSWSHYQTEKSFFKLYGMMLGRYNDLYTSSTHPHHPDDSNRDIHKYFKHEFRVGYGVGKVRNVTPVIRALRFRERLNAFEKGITLTDANLQDVAHHIALYSGYNSVYDRAGKYFWTDLFNIIPDIENNLSRYEYNNLRELFREDVGSRLEGWDLVFSMHYSNIYNDLSQRKEQFWGPGSQFRLYHNLSLMQQIGINADLFYGFSAHSDPGNEQQGYFHGTCEYLYNMTDRLLFESNLSASVYYQKPDDKNYEVWNHPFEKEYRWDTQFQYYIEDDLALVSRIGLYLGKDHWGNFGYDDEMGYQISMSLHYYLDRKLFK